MTSIKTKILRWVGVIDLRVKLNNQEVRLNFLSTAIDEKIKELDKLTREDWDIGARGSSTVILTGVYRGRGYVSFYEVPADHFHSLVEEFRSRRKDHLIRNVDAPFHISGAFEL